MIGDMWKLNFQPVFCKNGRTTQIAYSFNHNSQCFLTKLLTLIVSEIA